MRVVGSPESESGQENVENVRGIGRFVRAFGLEKLTEVQKVSIPRIIEREECLIVAETGSGKTEAVMIPLMKMMGKPISCLYITPLRALNRDMLSRLKKAAETLGYRAEVRHGDTSPRIRREQLLEPPEILITTPETLQAIIVAPRFREHLRNVKFVVIDEIHELLDSKRGSQLICGLARLRRLAKFRQYGLSATISEPHRVGEYFWEKQPTLIEVKNVKKKEAVVEVPRPSKEDVGKDLPVGTAAKLRRVHELLHNSNTLLFTNTRSTAEVLTAKLSKFIDVNIHHGSLSKEHRESVEKRFKSGEISKIISTSSLELGIDIGHIEQVVQYGSPRRADSFTQRLGRSGHSMHMVSKGIIICDLIEAPESAVIARRALEGRLERVRFPEAPLDVLAHQLVGLSLEEREVDIGEAYGLFRKTAPFRSLTRKEFIEVARLMESFGYLRIMEGWLHRRKSAWKYYYENISTIPDERKFSLIDSATGKRVASLDADFVNDLSPGSQFVVAGSAWTLLNVEGDRLYCAPAGESEEVATWSGELIPVEFEVAQEIPDAINFPERFPYESGTAELVKRLGKYDRSIRVERWGRYTVVITWAGSRVNNVLAHIVGSYLSLRAGSSIGIRSDQLGLVVKWDSDEVERVMGKIAPENLEKSVIKSIKYAPKFKKHFRAVAVRFGALERGALAERGVLKLWEGSVIEREAIREFLHSKMDFENTRRLLSSAEMVRAEQSRIGRYMLEKFHPEVFEAERPKKQIISALKARLEGTRLKISCMYCKTYLGRFQSEHAPERCPLCGSVMLGVLHNPELLKKKEKTVREKRELENARLSAQLFADHGRLALIIQAGKGIGPNTAARIIRTCKNTEEMLYRVYELEKQYARTKPFW